MSINLYITTSCDSFIQLYLMDWVTKVKSCTDVAILISSSAVRSSNNLDVSHKFDSKKWSFVKKWKLFFLKDFCITSYLTHKTFQNLKGAAASIYEKKIMDSKVWGVEDFFNWMKHTKICISHIKQTDTNWCLTDTLSRCLTKMFNRYLTNNSCVAAFTKPLLHSNFYFNTLIKNQSKIIIQTI